MDCIKIFKLVAYQFFQFINSKDSLKKVDSVIRNKLLITLQIEFIPYSEKE